MGLNALEHHERFEEQASHYFYLENTPESEEHLRLCVPLIYPNWLAIPKSAVASMEEVGSVVLEGKTTPKVKVTFNQDFAQLDSILPSFQELVIDEAELVNGADTSGSTTTEMFSFGRKWRWKPPWTWSRCAKCRLSVNTFIATVVLVATAGGGPGALAVAKALIIKEYSLAAWEAVQAIIFSASVGEISRRICKAENKC